MTYDPVVGRWLEEDPIGFEGGDANLHRYVHNDPTNRTDPSGLQEDDPNYFSRRAWEHKKNGTMPGADFRDIYGIQEGTPEGKLLRMGCYGVASLRTGCAGLSDRSQNLPPGSVDILRHPGLHVFANECTAVEYRNRLISEGLPPGSQPVIIAIGNEKVNYGDEAQPFANNKYGLPEVNPKVFTTPSKKGWANIKGQGINIATGFPNEAGVPDFWEWMGTGIDEGDFNVKHGPLPHRSGGNEIYYVYGVVVTNSKFAPPTQRKPRNP